MTAMRMWWMTGVRLARAAQRDSDGSALVEGVVVVPFLIVLLFGVYEFSWFFYQQHVISTGLRDAARYLARSHDPCDFSSPIWGAAQEGAKNLAATGSIGGGPARVKGWTAAMVVPRCTQVDNSPPARGQSAYRGGLVIYVVTVSTRFTDPSLGFFGLFGLPSPIISVSHSERVIGPG
jgi:Flp pilus assembly protein TadG